MKQQLFKWISGVLLFCFLNQILFPTVALALTTGPALPETESFAPIGATDMVDLFTGDVSYNIPLLDVGGYPINLFYTGGVSIDQEASWVGLGWNLNVGSITRQMRGLPDDFKGDLLTRDFNMQDNITYGVNTGVGFQIAGIKRPSIGINLSVMKNNQKGLGLSFGANVGLSSGSEGKGKYNANLGLNFSSFDGASLSASAQASANDFGASVNGEIGSRNGLKSLTFTSDSFLKALTARHSRQRLETITTNASKGTSDKGAKALKGLKASAYAGSKSFAGNPAVLSFSGPTYIPFSTLPMHNTSVSYSGTVGVEALTAHPNFSLGGYYSKQEIKDSKLLSHGYGYLYSGHGRNSATAQHDFNREKDNSFVKTIPVIAIPNYTYDLFSANAQGLSGQFRASRGDVGVLYDRSINSTNQSMALGLEFGVATIMHGGADFTVNEVYNELSKWTSDNNMKSYVGFNDPTSSPSNFEDVCFRLTGEQVPASADFISKVNNDKLMHIGLLGRKASAPNYFNTYTNTNQEQGLYYVNNAITRKFRENRNLLWSYLTAEEAQKVGMEKILKSYDLNTLTSTPCNVNGSVFKTLPRIDKDRKSHHISEVSILKEDGKKYTFGLPVYNLFQKEVTFSVEDQERTAINCTYNDTDPTKANDKGRDHYFSSDYLPSYSNAFLLTGILSPDYVDRTNNGITPDDYGTAIKFNYTRTADSFGWRSPFSTPKIASYNEGYEADDKDSKASYVYGRKELWYAHSIESNNYLIQFYLEDREDGLGAKNEIGEIDTDTRQKLIKEIRLYSKSDVVQFGDDAVPIKTVHFVYDYSLCINVPNNSNTLIDNSSGAIPYYLNQDTVNQGGKLTLKKVYFTYGKSTFGAINSYEFDYNDTPAAIEYKFGHSDRWGSYKEPGASLTNADFPYTSQDTSLTNTYIRYWLLNEIYLPSGGKIEFEYESDDYAYVQDKRAMQMFPIEGFSNNLHSSVPAAFSSKLYNGTSTNNIVYFQYPTSLGTLSKAKFRELFLEEVYNRTEPYIYYKCLVDICHNGKYDFVSGYAKLSDFGVIPNTNYGWLQLSHVEGDNPISSQAWLKLRQSLGLVAYPGSSGSNNVIAAVTGLVSAIGEAVSIFTGFPSYARGKDFGRHTIPSQSFIRLCNPEFKKLGGGYRVKQVTIHDNWAMMDVTGQSSVYGQQYDYTIKEEVNGVYQEISSGVATYEPLIGGDENPFRYPRNYSVKKKFGIGPTDRLHVEEPFGESLFPSASVGYRKVTVKPLEYPGVIRSKAGTTVHEFYTAYDFPVSWNSTLLKSEASRKIHETNFLLKLFGFLPVEDFQSASQGFVVQTNDMHGRSKKTMELDANGQVLSSTTHYYKVQDETIPNKKLVNEVPVVARDGSISKQTLGYSVDMWTDMRQEESRMIRFGIQANLDVIYIPPFFIIPIPIPYPEFGLETTRFRSAALVKQIHRVGILDRTETVIEGARNFSKNILFDGETGESMLVAFSNEFKDTLYNYHYPAHWMYDNMGLAFKNIGTEFKNVTITSGVHNNSAIDIYCSHGDELMYKIGPSTQPVKLWAVKDGSEIKFIDFDGQPVNLTNVSLKVIESGRKNMITSKAGNIVFLKDKPINVSGTGEYVSLALDKRVIDASITEYEHQWKSNCEQIPYSYQAPMPFECEIKDTVCVECCTSFFEGLHVLINDTTSNIMHSNMTNGVGLWDVVPFPECQDWLPCNSEFEAIYSLDPSLYYSNHYELAIGSCCRLMINGIGGRPFHVDSITHIVPIEGCCANVYAYTFGADHSPTDTLVATACLTCTFENHTVCINSIRSGDTINPFVLNMENNWQPKKTWAYNEKRTDFFDYYHFVRDHGDYKDFVPFWEYTSGVWNQDLTADRWVKANEITAINRFGYTLETRNALEIPSSNLYGFTESLVKAEAANARYRDIANDNFEDYTFPNNCLEPCYMEHWSFIDAVTAEEAFLVDSIAHTGLHSILINARSEATVFRDIANLDDILISKWYGEHYEMANGCNYKFAPQSGKYVLSAWVKEDLNCNVLRYEENQITVSINGPIPTIYNFSPSGLIIEGWQRYYEEFDVPTGATSISVTLEAFDSPVYFDDIRIQPFNSTMKAYVFNKNNLKLMAVLDENNYATFYEYNEEGVLIRIKKETERGILTLNENKRTLIRK